jgi:hypothetical protein
MTSSSTARVTSVDEPRPFLTRSTALEAAVAALIGLTGALIVFGPLLGQFWSPLGGGDLFSTYVSASFWNPLGLFANEHLGFPAGMDSRYFPGLDVTQGVFAQAVNAATGSSFLGVNLLLLLSYPVVAAIAYLTIRLTGFRGPIAIALAASYALIPYHWDRGLGHVYLATMYSAALGVALALLIGSGSIPRALAPGRLAWLRWSLLIGLVVAIAWSGIYYAFFTLILAGASWVWRLAMGDDRRSLLLSAAPLVAIAVLFVSGLLPALVQMRVDAPLAPISERLPVESVTYAGNLAMAVLPAPLSDLPGLAGYNSWAASVASVTPAGESSGLGNFGTWITFGCLLVFLIGGVLRLRAARVRQPPVVQGSVTWSLVAYLVVVATLFFVPLSLNLLFANLVSPQIRGWNRLLPMILLLFVLGACVVLARWSPRPVLSLPIALVILAATVSGSVLPYRSLYEGTARNAAVLADQARDYAAQVNAAIPDVCGVLQLPYVPYPEAGLTPPALQDYEHFVTALLNPGKNFSYGAVKNTSASTFVTGLSTPLTPGDLTRLQQAGFCAVHLDLRGYEPGPLAQTQVILQAMLGDPIANGRDGAWLTYALPRP